MIVLKLFPALQGTAYTRTLSLHQDGTAKKREADLLDSKGGFKSLLWVPTGRGERQMVRSTSSLPI